MKITASIRGRSEKTNVVKARITMRLHNYSLHQFNNVIDIVKYHMLNSPLEKLKSSGGLCVRFLGYSLNMMSRLNLLGLGPKLILTYDNGTT